MTTPIPSPHLTPSQSTPSAPPAPTTPSILHHSDHTTASHYCTPPHHTTAHYPPHPTRPITLFVNPPRPAAAASQPSTPSSPSPSRIPPARAHTHMSLTASTTRPRAVFYARDADVNVGGGRRSTLGKWSGSSTRRGRRWWQSPTSGHSPSQRCPLIHPIAESRLRIAGRGATTRLSTRPHLPTRVQRCSRQVDRGLSGAGHGAVRGMRVDVALDFGVFNGPKKNSKSTESILGLRKR